MLVLFNRSDHAKHPYSSQGATPGLTLIILILSLTGFFVQPSPVSAGGPWFVSTLGNDANSCLFGSPCLKIGFVILNRATTPGDTIYVDAGTYPDTLPEIVISVTIIGAGMTSTIIDGSGTIELFHISGGVSALSNLTIQNGKPPVASSFGGGLRNESGSQVALTNVTLKGNKANYGGGIFNAGVMTLTNANIYTNTASFSGGGIDNTGIMTVSNSTINSNFASQTGGGIQNDSPGNLSLANVTISANAAPFFGGGLYNPSGSSARLVNVTINSNSAPFAGGGGGINNGGTMAVTNTIVANSPLGGNCSGNMASSTNNMATDATCDSGFAQTTTAALKLGLLALNPPGTTQTHALFYSSPAINAGINTGCPSTDQRGIPRPVITTCDIGSYEFNLTNTLIFPLIRR